MKTLLFSLLASVALIFPTLAHQEEETVFYTYEAMDCMRRQKCTVGVDPVNVLDYYNDDEVRTILTNLNQMGVKVYASNPQYFVDDYHALYYADSNTIYLNKGYTDEPEMFIETLRHEAWHAAQDCMGGGMHNSDIMPMLAWDVIPADVVQDTFDRYGFDPDTVRIEREAVLAMTSPWMTVDALEACNSDTPIWETYPPPKKTWSYLYWNGHVSYHDGI